MFIYKKYFDSDFIVKLKNILNMEATWVPPKTIIGKEAIGDYYFGRKNLEEKIWREIKKGNNILFTAPRRSGRTSVRKSLSEQSNTEYKLYKDGKESEANNILKNLRYWRQQKGFEKIQFIFAGSIGIPEQTHPLFRV